MRRAVATSLITLTAPAAASAAEPIKHANVTKFATQKAVVALTSVAKAQRAARARRARRARAAATTIPGYLAQIAACESGGNPRAIGAGGLYRGMFQMTYAAWGSVGGAGDPAAAGVSEQVRRAGLLYAQRGAGQWPNCAG
jgi:hypothetical protein